MEKNKVKKEHWIEMSNKLNLMRSARFGLNEFKVLEKYLSRINPREDTTRKVVFTLEEFQADLGITELREHNLRLNVEALLSRVVFVPQSNRFGQPTRGFTAFQLFKEISVTETESGWKVCMDCHDLAKDLFFDLVKDGYFKYKLKYTMRLGSVNQMRMYLIMKGNEFEFKDKEAPFTITISELIDLLKINPKIQWRDFRRDVLDVCQQALEELTDIKFEYKARRKGRSYYWIDFYIKSNSPQEPLQLNFDEYELEASEEERSHVYENKNLEFLAEACDFEFDNDEMRYIYTLLSQVPIEKGRHVLTDRYNYLCNKYNYLKMRASKTNIPKRYEYFISTIQADIKEETKAHV
ncbi:MAG: replication initiation protein [Firmicutes bacterium]|nr:replication initiation protein [Bacillota bacterium]